MREAEEDQPFMKKLKKVIGAIGALIILMSVMILPAGAEENTALSFSDLTGMTGAVKDGTIQDKVLEGLVTDPDIQYYKTMADECLALDQGKVDYALVIREQYSTISEEYPDLVLAEDLSASCGQVGYGFAKSRAGDEIREKLDRYLLTITESGDLQKLQDKWFTPGEKEAVEIPSEGENGILTVATAATSPPFIYLMGEDCTGFEAELLADFGRECGYGISFEVMDFNGLLPAITGEKCDLAANCLAMTEERKQEINFSEVTSEPMYTILMRKETLTRLTGQEAESADTSSGNFFERIAGSFRKTFIVEGRWKLILRGCATTLLLTALSALIGSFLGFEFYKLRVAKSRLCRRLIGIFNAIMGGMPMVVLLMIFYYIVFGSIAIPPFFVAVIAFSLNFGSVTSEIYLNCIQSVPKGQTEAALALGYSDRMAFRRFVYPQAMRRALPLVRGQAVALLKGTAIVGFISIQDLTKMGDLIRSRTYEAFFPLIVIAIIYFLLAWLIRVTISRLERRWDPERRRQKRLAASGKEADHE